MSSTLLSLQRLRSKLRCEIRRIARSRWKLASLVARCPWSLRDTLEAALRDTLEAALRDTLEAALRDTAVTHPFSLPSFPFGVIRRVRRFLSSSPFLNLCLSVFICGLFLLSLTGCLKAGGGAEKPAALPAVDWPIFRGEAGLTGRTTGRLPGRLVLDFKLAALDDVAASPVIAGGRLYAATAGGTLVAFDLESRAKIWEYKSPDGFEAAPFAVPEEGLVVAGGVDGAVYALDAESGKLKWKAETAGKIAGSANACRAGGRALVLVGSWDNSLYAFDAADGKIAWRFPTANYVNGAPAVAGGLAAFGGCDARLHFVDCASGRELGSVDTGAYVAGSAALVDGAGGVAYVGNYGGRLLAVDAATRRTRWSFSLPPEGRGFVASPAVADTRVVIGAKDGFVYCLDRATGTLVWKFQGRDEYQASCITDGARVLAAAADGELALLDLASGRLLSSYDVGADVTGSPAVAAGRLAVAALDGNVYVFRGE